MLRPFTSRAVWFIASRPLYARSSPVLSAKPWPSSPVASAVAPWSLGGALELDLSGPAGPGDDWEEISRESGKFLSRKIRDAYEI